MGDMMSFPKTFEEFAEMYKIVDKEQIYTNGSELIPIFRVKQWLYERPTADVVEVEKVSEQIIRRKAEVSEYWQNDVKQYRALKGYSDIEHDTDTFLRGYNEAVEDMLAILDGRKVTK